MSRTTTKEKKAAEQEQDGRPTGTEIAVLGDGAIDSQIATAKRYPRTISRFVKDARDLATADEETAGECLYALPRAGKTIEGPSVRLAEILAHTWGNCRVDAEVIEEGDTHVVAMGTFFDLERNVAVRKKVKRRITDKHGRRYNEDMIGTTSNAAISIALRNAVLAGIPRTIWKSIYQAARKASLGEGGTLAQKRQAMLEWFGKLGIQPEQIFALLELGGLEDISEDALITLRGLCNAIREGEATVEDIFPRPGSIDVGQNKTLNEILRKKAGREVGPDAEKPAAPVVGGCAHCGTALTNDNRAGEGLCLACAEKAEQGDLEL